VQPFVQSEATRSARAAPRRTAAWRRSDWACPRPPSRPAAIRPQQCVLRTPQCTAAWRRRPAWARPRWLPRPAAARHRGVPFTRRDEPCPSQNARFATKNQFRFDRVRHTVSRRFGLQPPAGRPTAGLGRPARLQEFLAKRRNCTDISCGSCSSHPCVSSRWHVSCWPSAAERRLPLLSRATQR
jgi:hypothetical protein